MSNDRKDQIFIGLIFFSIFGGAMAAIFSEIAPVTLLIQIFLFVLIMYVLFYPIPTVLNRVKQWVKNPQKGNIHLTPDKVDFKSNKCDLRIKNNEWRKKFMVIDRAVVCYDEKPILDRSSGVKLNWRGTKTMSFITFKKKEPGFSIKDSNLRFFDGSHNFAVSVIFSSPGRRNEYVRWFNVTVSYRQPHSFHIWISARITKSTPIVTAA